MSKIIVDLEKALMEWLEGMPFLTDRLYFDFLGGHHGSCAVSPLSENAVVKRYINGDKIRQYTFALQVMLQVSDATDDVNTENMFALRKWQEWIEEQEAQKNYPDFGERCSDYQVENLNNMPNRAMWYDNGLVKYQFFAKITYFEKGR